MNRTEHLLACIAEEACEIGQAATKCLRFAVDGHYPDGTPNTTQLQKEIADLMTVIAMLKEEGVGLTMSPDEYLRHKAAKRAKVEEYMKLARERGALSD